MEWTVLKDADAVAKTACERIVQASREAISSRGVFHIVLAGGNTPARTYALLACADCNWKHWHIWFGDERCLHPHDPERNSVMVEKSLTSKVAIPAQQVHEIAAELGPEVAAQQYQMLIEEVAPFDMVILGLGEDGHTASLFPGQNIMPDKAVLPVHEAPKSPAERVTLSAAMLSQCRHLLFIITGDEKSDAVSRWRSGEALPVSYISALEKAEVLLDRHAMPS